MLTRRQLGLGLGSLGLGGFGLDPALAQSAGAPVTGTRLSPDEDAEFNTSFDPRLRMLGPVKVEGRGPHQFVVDTGANRSVISIELARELGLPPGPDVLVHGIAGNEVAPTVRVREFEVAQIVNRDLEMPTLPRRRLGADGLLGLDALRGRAVELDYRRRRVKLMRSKVQSVGHGRLTTDSRQPGAIVKARFRFGQLTIVIARAGNAAVTAFLDSGSQATVGNMALQRAVATRKLAVPGAGRTVPIYSVTSQVAYGQYEVIRLLSFDGDTKLRNLPVIFSELNTFKLWGLTETPALLIGADTLSSFSQVTLDFGRAEVVFNP